MNFTWWVDSKDHGGNNLFQGGFMGLDNISPLDRSALPPEVGYLEQADSTAWMAMYALDLLDMALRLARHDRAYEDVATKFFEHFLTIAGAANTAVLWDEQDAYFYDVLHLTDGVDMPIKVKSLVGLVPISAALAYDHCRCERPARLRGTGYLVPGQSPRIPAAVPHPRHRRGQRHQLLALVPPERLVRLLDNVFEESGLLSDYGIRAISAWHREHPFTVQVGGVTASVDYEPAESTSNLFGGNSNWRGPIWMPLNVLLVEALRDYDRLAPGEVTVEYPAGSGDRLTTAAADDISRRLISIFLPGRDGRRPVHGWYDLLATDPRWKDNIPFHEYFHGDTGMGLGAEHQTGWTALVAHLILTTPPGSPAGDRPIDPTDAPTAAVTERHGQEPPWASKARSPSSPAATAVSARRSCWSSPRRAPTWSSTTSRTRKRPRNSRRRSPPSATRRSG